MTKAYVTKNLVCNIDGTVTYWSSSRQEWVCRTRHIAESDLIAMNPGDRNRALFHLTRNSSSDVDYSA
jgi:hypothetical protein